MQNMVALISQLILALCYMLSSNASPLPKRAASITPLSNNQISAFKPFTFFAGAAHCSPATTINWTCGANCEANPDFQPQAVGGDGTDTQFWFVGFEPSSKNVIVAHQGTDFSSIKAILVDADIIKTSLDQTLFPGISSSIEVHQGFAESHSRSALDILAAVEATLSKNPGASVVMVGHSLGGALALLDAVFLPLHLPGGTKFTTITYGMPRVGNQAFADYIDSHVASLTHINNKKDPVPILPGRFLGFHHPSGEAHIQSDGSWDSCPGQDNTSKLCEVGDVPNILFANPDDHIGPYDGVSFDIDCSQ